MNAPPPSPLTHPREFLNDLYMTAVRRALPEHNLPAYLPAPPTRAGGGLTLVLGAGKAGGAMAAALDAAWPQDVPLSGLVVTRYDHVPPAYKAHPGRIEVVEAAHPVPDEAGRRAAQRIVDLAHGLTPQDLVICLISGGGSALLALPTPGVSLQEKQAIHKALLESGAAIDEMNCVRKHFSAIKGGRLGALCAPARVVSLIISDVPGDDPAVIASGPTVPDPSTCAEALAILDRFGLSVPNVVRAGLESGAFETPKPGDPRFANHEVRLIATPQLSLEAAAERAREAGIDAHILSDRVEGESREVGKVHAALAQAVAQRGQPFRRPCVVLSGGETTVTVRDRSGRGGRASEFLLGCAVALHAEPRVHVLAADTDGIDGLQENAGAIVTPDTLARATLLGLKPRDTLERNDCYTFFRALGDLITPGPTFTNVNDFRAMLIV